MGQATCGSLCGKKSDDFERGSGEETAPLSNHQQWDHGGAGLGMALPPQQVIQVVGETSSARTEHKAGTSESGPVAVASTGGGTGEAPEGVVAPSGFGQGGGASGTAVAGACDAGGAGTASGGQLLVELPGRRRSLLVGINYYGTSAALSGCVNDVRRMREALSRRWGFPEDEASQRVLLDEPSWPPGLRPTLSNMRAAIAWLVEGARTGDALYFHYSGHGGREPAEDGQHHETLCPVDFQTAGMLLDTEMFDILVRRLPAGCRLTCVLDCCHSAGALDLPFVFVGSKENLDRALAGEALDMAVSKSWMRDAALFEQGHPEALLGDLASMGLGLWELYKKREASKEAGATGFAGSEAAHNAGLAVGEVLAFTGCRSDQTSADVGDVHAQFGVSHAASGVQAGDHAGGALTAVLLESLDGDASEPGHLTYLELLERMRTRLRQEGFSQVPQLASSLLVELQHRFSLCTAFVPPDPSKARGSGGSRGFDAADGAIVAGGAACAAGFLAAMAASPHGAPMLREATTSNGWAPYRDMDFGVGDGHQQGLSAMTWGTMYSGEEPPMAVIQAEQPLAVGGHSAEPLLSWGQAEDPTEEPLASRDHASGVLESWGQPEKIHESVNTAHMDEDPHVPSSDPLLLGEGHMEAWGTAEPPSSSYAQQQFSWGEPELEEEAVGLPRGVEEVDDDDDGGLGLDDEDIEDFDDVGDEGYDDAEEL
mmetsp:Transcript_4328/g.8629  ORF Transcript_4328/g.8629 Transcript_4328/m.8629 type:complete len:712 (-) Transcript_4328:82-2217(-)